MKTYLTQVEVALIEKATTNLRDRLLVRLLFHLGCRISEALALKVGDVDFVSGTITIEHLKSRLELFCPNCGARLGRGHSFCPKCGSRVEEVLTEQREHRRVRTLPIDDDTLGILGDYVERGGPVLRGGRILIFVIDRYRGWQIIRDCAEKAGLPKLVNPKTGRVHNVSPHRLRDASAVHAMKLDDSGDGLRLLQEHLGHASFNTTARYRKVSGEEHRDWYRKLWGELNVA